MPHTHTQAEALWCSGQVHPIRAPLQATAALLQSQPPANDPRKQWSMTHVLGPCTHGRHEWSPWQVRPHPANPAECVLCRTTAHLCRRGWPVRSRLVWHKDRGAAAKSRGVAPLLPHTVQGRDRSVPSAGQHRDCPHRGC